jgi:hypothetical protein
LRWLPHITLMISSKSEDGGLAAIPGLIRSLLSYTIVSPPTPSKPQNNVQHLDLNHRPSLFDIKIKSHRDAQQLIPGLTHFYQPSLLFNLQTYCAIYNYQNQSCTSLKNRLMDAILKFTVKGNFMRCVFLQHPQRRTYILSSSSPTQSIYM